MGNKCWKVNNFRHSQKKEKLMTESEKALGPRARSCKEPELESAIILWFTDVCSRNLPVTCDMLKEKSKTFGEQLGVENFTYSNSWLNRFKERRGITLQSVHRECAAANVVEVSKGRKIYKKSLLTML